MSFSDEFGFSIDNDANEFDDVNEQFFDDMEDDKNTARLDYIRLMAQTCSCDAQIKFDLLNAVVDWSSDWFICAECGKVVYAGEMLVLSDKIDENKRVLKIHRCEDCGAQAIDLAYRYDSENDLDEELITDILDDYTGGY